MDAPPPPGSTPPPGSPLPPPVPPAPRRRVWDVPIARDRANGKLGGVVAGVACAYRVDVRAARVITVLACLVAPPLAALYLAAMLFLPADPQPAVGLSYLVKGKRWVPVVAIVVLVSAIVGVGSLDLALGWRGLSWGVVLILAGVGLWVSDVGRDRSDDADASTPAPAPGMPGAPDARVVYAPEHDPEGAAATTGAAPEAPTWARPAWSDTPTGPATPPAAAAGAAARRRYPILGLAVAGVAAVVGLVAAVDALGWVKASPAWVIALAGTALVVAAIVSGAVNHRVLPTLAVAPLAALVVGLCIARPDLRGGVGERTVRPATAAEVAGRQHLGMGALTIDLRDVAGAEPVTVEAEVGLGELRVLVPEGVTVRVDAEVRAGVVFVDGDEVAHGLHVHPRLTSGGEGAVVDLDLEVGAGSVSVERAAAPAR